MAMWDVAWLSGMLARHCALHCCVVWWGPAGSCGMSDGFRVFPQGHMGSRMFPRGHVCSLIFLPSIPRNLAGFSSMGVAAGSPLGLTTIYPTGLHGSSPGYSYRNPTTSIETP